MSPSLRNRIHPICLRGLLGALLALSAFPVGAQTETPGSVATPAAKTPSQGTYSDRAGGKANWQINGSHALVWNGTPYLPIGGTFTPRSFENDTAWQEDVKALARLKTAGLLDLIIAPAKSLAEVPPAALQRLLDYLDTNDFRYGLAFGSGLSTPLTGTVVKPATYRFANTQDTLSATFQVSDSDRGYYVLADSANDNNIVRSGNSETHEGVLTVPIEAPPTARVVALLYPHKALPVNGDGALPDLWAGFDDYRDKTLTYLAQIKFGKGFRFFLDPLTKRIGLGGETDFLVPDSPGFDLEWEGFLTQRYPNLSEAKIAWGLADGDVKTHHELARLIPLWANVNGVPYLYDPLTRRNLRVMDARESKWWEDFLRCRNESVTYYMNAMADLLKKQVADVPVVYTWTQTHPIFWNTNREGGYDGLAVAARGQGRVSRVIAPAYSEAEQSDRAIWCIASELVSDTNQLKSPPQPGYPTRAALFRDLDDLRRVGIKGFFVNGFQARPDPASGAGDWLTASESVDWLREYATRLSTEVNAANYAPGVLFFPQFAPGPARVGQVPGASNVLWLNSFYGGEAIDWWPAYSGYTIQRGENQEETVLMSLQGKRETHFLVPDVRQVKAFTADGAPVPIKTTGKTSFTILMDETPIVFQTGRQHLVPQEAAEMTITQLAVLMQQALLMKAPGTDNTRPNLEAAKEAYRQKDYERAYVLARAALDEMTYYVAPYIWLEGERPYVHSFGEVAPNLEASGGGYLRLSTPNDPNRVGYGARYVFNVPADGRYTLWLAGTVPGPGTSPIRWRINAEPEQEVAGTTPQGSLYLGERFGWIVLGTVNLKKGPEQSLSIYVVGRAASPPQYIFSIDALMLTTHPFTPNGPIRPLPIDTSSVARERRRDK